MPENWLLGLIGFPLGHSYSPTLHQNALAEAGLNGEYSLYPIPQLPEGQNDLNALIERLRHGELQGLNVTIPHKQSVLTLVDELSPAAAAIGACNTLVSRNGRVTGENTDAPGFLADMSHLPLQAGKHALVLGAGGAARAVAYSLLEKGWRVTITDINPNQTAALVQQFTTLPQVSKGLIPVEYSPASIIETSLSLQLIVNTSPVGMHPNDDASPWPFGLPFPAGACLYDLVYNPSETRLMREARQAGMVCRNGFGMLVEQAALAFKLWTGFSPNRANMRKGIDA